MPGETARVRIASSPASWGAALESPPRRSQDCDRAIRGFGEGEGDGWPLQSGFRLANTLLHHVMNVTSLRGKADPLRMPPGTAEDSIA
jgi:hypothetical protein